MGDTMRLSAAILGLLLSWPAGAETVGFDSADASRRGKATRIAGELARPAGPGPFPAIVAMHGCSGLRSKSGAVTAKYQEWSALLVRAGYVALMADSFTPRGFPEVCTKNRGISAEVDRADDARGALTYLKARGDVRGDRIGLIGWSHGGAVTLSTMFSTSTDLREFRAAVAFYPSCLRSYPGGKTYRPYAPLLILIGAADDWTPAAPCIEPVENAKRGGAPIDMVVYPDAHHGFETANVPARFRPDVLNRTKPGGCCGATIGTNDAARADAIPRAVAFFDRHVKGAP